MFREIPIETPTERQAERQAKADAELAVTPSNGAPPRRPRTGMAALWGVLGLAIGITAASVLFAQSRTKQRLPTDEFTPMPSVSAPFDIVDTPGSTFLLNKSTGQVWRLGFTEVSGDRYWFGTHVPVQQPGTFDEFQQNLRRRLKNAQQ